MVMGYSSTKIYQIVSKSGKSLVKYSWAIEHWGIILYGLIFAYIVLGGIWSLRIYSSIRAPYKVFYDINNSKAILYLISGYVLTIIGYIFGNNFASNSVVHIVLHKGRSLPKTLSLRLIMILTLVMGVLINMETLLKLSYKPILFFEDGELIKGSDSLIPTVGMYILALTAGWDLICIYERKMNKLYFLVPLFKVTFILAYSGSRMTVMWPIIMIVAYFYIHHMIKIKHIIYIIILTPILIFALVSYKYILTFGFNTGFTKQLMIMRFATDFAPEYREFGRIINLVPLSYDYIGISSLIINMFLMIIPNELLQLFGVDKSILFNPIGNINREILFSSGSLGIRTSFYGDMFISSGIIGILFFSLLIGILLGYNTKKSFLSPTAFLMVINISTLQLFTLETFLLRCLMIALSTIFYNRYLRYIFVNKWSVE